MNQEVSATSTGFCHRCGNKLPEGAFFCSSCGFDLRAVPSSVVPVVPQLSRSQSTIQVRKTLMAVMLVAIAALGIVATVEYVLFTQQTTNLQSNLTALQDKANAYYSQLQGSQTQNSQLQAQVSSLQSQNSYLQSQLQSLNLGNTHPTLTIWTSCGGSCTIGPTGWRAGGVPDTFTYSPSYTASVAVGMYFLTLTQYVQFATCPLTGSAENQLSCVTGLYSYYSPTTSLNGVFHLAEGCASYVAVYYSDSSGVMYPNVSVTYNPASTLTGACA